ncbi:MAG: hypothetical protein ABIA75_07795 [Candidatus Neomarinimicrobiota bacterium]
MIILSGLVLAVKPDISISTTALYPRVGMLDADEATFWCSVLTYRQSFGSRLSLESQIEIGSETGSLPNPFRVYNLTAGFDLGKINLELGRIATWNSFISGRVDGAKFNYSLGKLGSLEVLGGFKAVSDFSDTAFVDKQLYLVSWSQGRLGNNRTVIFWTENDGAETNSYAGGSLTRPLPSDIKLYSNLAWSLTDSKAYQARVRLSKAFRQHTISAGFRQKRYLQADPYPWINRSITAAPIVTLGVTSRVGTRLIWWNQFVHRFSESNINYFRSTAAVGPYSLSFVGGYQDKQTLFGVSAGLRKPVSRVVTAGGSFSINARTYDDLIEPQKSIGLYGWTEWQPAPLMAIRIFGRFLRNPYYNYDTRGGVVINVAL